MFQFHSEDLCTSDAAQKLTQCGDKLYRQIRLQITANDYYLYTNCTIQFGSRRVASLRWFALFRWSGPRAEAYFRCKIAQMLYMNTVSSISL